MKEGYKNLGLEESLQLKANELRNSAVQVEDFFKKINPDFLVFTGKSSLISRAICRQSEAMRACNWAWFDSPLNRALTMIGSDDYEERAEKLLQQNHPQLTHDSRIMIIDEFSGSGAKSIYYSEVLKRLGFQSVNFAVFVSKYDHSHRTNFFSGSVDEELQEIMASASLIVGNAMRVGTASPAKPILKTITKIMSHPGVGNS